MDAEEHAKKGKTRRDDKRDGSLLQRANQVGPLFFQLYNFALFALRRDFRLRPIRPLSRIFPFH